MRSFHQSVFGWEPKIKPWNRRLLQNLELKKDTFELDLRSVFIVSLDGGRNVGANENCGFPNGVLHFYCRLLIREWTVFRWHSIAWNTSLYFLFLFVDGFFLRVRKIMKKKTQVKRTQYLFFTFICVVLNILMLMCVFETHKVKLC